MTTLDVCLYVYLDISMAYLYLFVCIISQLTDIRAISKTISYFGVGLICVICPDYTNIII